MAEMAATFDEPRPSNSLAAKLAVASLLVVLAGLVFAARAQAGFIVQPAQGATVGLQPTFLVYLEPSERSLALVYVATSPQMTSSGTPLNQVGSCIPNTPFGEPNKYTCKPVSYSPTFTSSLNPGTYYWWMTYFATDPGSSFATVHVSGPFQFTVARPTAPTDAFLVSPADGATVHAPVRFDFNLPTQAVAYLYVSTLSTQRVDGSPAGAEVFSCGDGSATTGAGDYHCIDDNSDGSLSAGQTYYWWIVVTVDGASWIYGPRSFHMAATSGGGGGGGGGGSTQPHVVTDAPYLPSSAQFRGTSIKETRLSQALYTLSKLLGPPRMVNVACWSDRDWPSVSGYSGDGFYTTLGFYMRQMPRWIELSPGVCRALETLLHHRPIYPNRFTSNAIETLTHEDMHALGVTSEAAAECLAMQLSIFLAVDLNVPYNYADKLARLNLINYASRPPNYRSVLCREGGKWDLIPNRPSPPWHSYNPG